MQTTITSMSNDKIKYVRSLSHRTTRYAERRLVIEGRKLIQEALRAGVTPALVLYTGPFVEAPDGAELVGGLSSRGASCERVAPRLLAAVADTTTPQGILAVIPFPDLPAPANPDLILIVDQVATPGNLGTLLRSAEAAGVGMVWMTKGTTDPYDPKVVRGGMGVHFRLPLRSGCEWDQVAQAVRGRSVYLAEAGPHRPYYAVDWTLPCALIVGNEARGPAPMAWHLMTEAISIPMFGETESLNVGVAGSVILFEAARQRRLNAIADMIDFMYDEN